MRAAEPIVGARVGGDPRYIRNGAPVPGNGYADQPYVVHADDGAWVLVMTTGAGAEGDSGQHVISRRSRDQGRHWSEAVRLEPLEGPEASYAVAVKAKSGRIYCFYNYNAENRREVCAEDGRMFARVDSLGQYVFRFSDDHGRSWSPLRYPVPMREFACDRGNPYRGTVRFFWNVGRPLILPTGVLIPLHKVGAMGEGFFAQSEGCFLFSANLRTEPDPAAIRFETLPEGDVGLRTPPGGGRVAEEQSVTVLRDGSLFCVYRTVDGWPACAYSQDGGRHWTPPAWLTDAPGSSRRIKNPRAANFIWRCENGLFLYWFHNHGGPAVRAMPGHASPMEGTGRRSSGTTPYDDRNPAWLMSAREVETPDGLRLVFSEPEILLYDENPFLRMSYPDLVEQDGRYWITETDKRTARVHAIPDDLLEGLFHPADAKVPVSRGLILEVCGRAAQAGETEWPQMSWQCSRALAADDAPGNAVSAIGFSLAFSLCPASIEAGQCLVDGRADDGNGICVHGTDRGTLALVLNDGRCVCGWDTDPGTIMPGQRHTVVFIVEGGPKIILCVVDGRLCDGGDARQFGWGLFHPWLRDIRGGTRLRWRPEVEWIRLYDRPLRVHEAVSVSR